MSSRIASLVVVDAENPERLAQFWSQVLGWTVRSCGQRTPMGHLGATIGAGANRGVEIDSRWVPETPSTQKNRLHLDINPTDLGQAHELAPLIGLGVLPVQVGQDKVTWYVLADPEGNEFRLCGDRVAALPGQTTHADAR